jgi:hypothetical protein
MKVISLEPQVNYVVSCPMTSTANEKEPLTICSTYLDLDLVVDMVNPSMGYLEPDISPTTPIKSLNIHSFQSIVLPSDEDLFEAMVRKHDHSSLCVSSSLKNETNNHEHSSIYVPRSLKNETDNHEHSSLSTSSSLKNEKDPPPVESSLPLGLVHEPSFPLPVQLILFFLPLG